MNAEKKSFDRNSNIYTVVFTIVLIGVVAVILAGSYKFFKPYYDQNVRQEKMTDILYTIGLDKQKLEESARAEGLPMSYNLIKQYFDQYIVKQLALNAEGKPVENVNAFGVNLKEEIQKPVEKQVYPLFIAEYQGKKYYIIPLYGKGLWDDIWGYVALEEDWKTIHGIKFGHKGETPGLGANITEKWFEDRFKGEKIFDESGNFTGIEIVKQLKDKTDKNDHKVDAISGATLTSNGVGVMLNERLKHYVPYFEKMKKQ